MTKRSNKTMQALKRFMKKSIVTPGNLPRRYSRVKRVLSLRMYYIGGMVRLDRIYTKGGDKGLTSLGDGRRVPKHHPRVAAYGDKDELDAVVGLLITQVSDSEVRDLLLSISNDLFDVGADLCVPDEAKTEMSLRVTHGMVKRLEKAIDRYNKDIPPLKSFVLRGGTPPAAWCHLACTVCRRAERSVTCLMESEPVNPQVLKYLNRLSDLLFVLARYFNDKGRDDILWEPGKHNE